MIFWIAIVEDLMDVCVHCSQAATRALMATSGAVRVASAYLRSGAVIVRRTVNKARTRTLSSAVSTVAWCTVVFRGALWWYVVHCGGTWCIVVLRGALWCYVVHCGVTWCTAVLRDVL